MKKKSKNAFKIFVNQKAKEYAFKIYMSSKQTHSKLDNLTYSKLEMQSYLKNMNAESGKLVFDYRMRMAEYGGNFRGVRGHIPCPLCLSHPDDQNFCFTCPIIQKSIHNTASFKYSDIFANDIPNTLAIILLQIKSFRSEHLNGRRIETNWELSTCWTWWTRRCCRLLYIIVWCELYYYYYY